MSRAAPAQRPSQGGQGFAGQRPAQGGQGFAGQRPAQGGQGFAEAAAQDRPVKALPASGPEGARPSGRRKAN